MAEWNAYYQNEEEDEEEQEEGGESSGEFKFTGRDSLVFLVDASKEMFIKGEDGEPSNFDKTMQCVRSVYTSKIISSHRDLVRWCSTETEHAKNHRNNFKHVYVYHDLDEPGAKRVQDVEALRRDRGAQLAGETLGLGGEAETCLSDALWCCSNLYSDIKLRLSHKRLMLFTCRDRPHGDDSARDRQARTRAGDLKETGVVIDLMHLMKPGGFDVSLFFCDLVSPPEDQDELGLQLQPSHKLEDLLKRVRAKEQKKRTLLSLCLAEGVSLAVGVYSTAVAARKPPAVRLYRENNGATYGQKQIVMEKDEVDSIKKFEDPALHLIGFKPRDRLKLYHHIRPSLFLYPEDGQKCSERAVFAVCRYIARRNNPPRFVALLPQMEVKMKEIVSKLRFKYKSESFENPAIQQHYRNLEALALDMMAPENMEDLIMPNADQMDARLGPLAQEFKDLVYPAGYNPDSKPAAKRKSADGGGGADKKPKVELQEAELRSHILSGTIGKLTVPVLKDACKQFGVRTTGTKKQELIDALKAKLAP
ncbi:hypothetical protein CRUP_032539 [Coryphaenoides rupestris]|nr:hypothetical protein CRUP_032539 [Coryphaenoides rupestris]